MTKQAMTGPVQKARFATVVESSGNEPTIVISTPTTDRDRDVVVAEGCVLDGYRRNPVVMFGHDYTELPVGVCTSVEVAAGRGVRARWRWLDGDERATRVRNAFEQGVLRAASVGFRVLASEPIDGGGRRFTRWELLEWSLVPVPANAEAVRVLRGLRLGADDGSVLELRDDDPGLEVDDDLAALARRAKVRSRKTVDDVEFDPLELREVLRELLPELVQREVRGLVARTVAAEVAQRRGRVLDSDAAALLGGGGDIARVKRAEAGASMAATMREAVNLGFRLAAGRLD